MKKNIRMIVDRIDREIARIIEATIDINHDIVHAQSIIWNNLSFIQYDLEELGELYKDRNASVSIIREMVDGSKRVMSNINSQNVRKKLMLISKEFGSSLMLSARMGLLAL